MFTNINLERSFSLNFILFFLLNLSIGLFIEIFSFRVYIKIFKNGLKEYDLIRH